MIEPKLVPVGLALKLKHLCDVKNETEAMLRAESNPMAISLRTQKVEPPIVTLTCCSDISNGTDNQPTANATFTIGFHFTKTKGLCCNYICEYFRIKAETYEDVFPIILHFLLTKAMNILFGYERNNECLIVYDWIFFSLLCLMQRVVDDSHFILGETTE